MHIFIAAAVCESSVLTLIELKLNGCFDKRKQIKGKALILRELKET